MSDMTLAEACSLTRNFGKFLKGMERLQEASDVLEASESVVRENENKVAGLKADIAVLEGERQRAKEAAVAAQDSARYAAEEGALAVAAAQSEAKKILDEANAKAAAALVEAAAARAEAEEAARAVRKAQVEEQQVLERIAAAKAAALATFG